MTPQEAAARRQAEQARQLALFRYRLIQETVSRELSTRQRGKLVRQIAARTHEGVDGKPVRVSRKSLDRWIHAWQRGGFEALLPSPRQTSPRSNADALALAVALKKENPLRTAVQVRQIMLRHGVPAPSERTIQRHFARLELSLDLHADGPVFSRFEAGRPNELWVGDALHGPRIGKERRRAILFCFIDDNSRAVMAGRFGFAEDVVRLAVALRPALACRGLPQAVYVDNGSAFVDSWLLRACASLGIKLVHSTPNRPEGRGKIERFFRTVRDQFLVEFDGAHPKTVDGLGELNRLFNSWVETIYHLREHSETGMPPLTRWRGGLPPALALPSAAALAEAFLWEERRTVDKTALISLLGNYYQVDPVLRRKRVQVLFDPFNLEEVEIRHAGRSYGTSPVFRRVRHAHPKARPETGGHTPPEPTGIDYLGLLDETRTRHLQGSVNYTALLGATGPSSSPDAQPDIA
ncbi:DDE-type integrase/transposase/recombinase [Nonomuraea sp. NPDC050451]|uniref:DDE-type integrase/transposase/recombinase n=1 Tax=Nonomuraea sp. NPDC050451 TaxID=3364364 RepID=UPI0037B57DF5